VVPAELYTTMLAYDQRPKSQHGIHDPEICTLFNFWTLVFIRLGRTSVRLLWRPRKHVCMECQKCLVG